MNLSYLKNFLLFFLKKNILINYFIKIITSYGRCLYIDIKEYLNIKSEAVLIKFKDKDKKKKLYIFFVEYF